MLPDYHSIQVLDEQGTAVIYRAIRQHDGLPVILKMLKLEDEQVSTEHIAHLSREYEVLNRLADVAGVARVHTLEGARGEASPGMPRLVLEDSGGHLLRDLAVAGTLSLIDAIKLARDLAATVRQLHERRIIHRDLKLANLLFHPGTGQVTIINFGLALVCPCENQEPRSQTTQEVPQPCLLPDQTECVNCVFDERGDLYALGTILYELLTGQHPSLNDNALELSHSHRDHQPALLQVLQWEIPETLLAIVLKLLERNPTDRYQSATGLEADLEMCLRQMQANGTVEPFVLGQEDSREWYCLAENLTSYGATQPPTDLFPSASLEHIQFQTNLGLPMQTAPPQSPAASDPVQAGRAVIELFPTLGPRLLSMMSQELRTPLNAVINFTRIVLQDPAYRLPEHHQDRLKRVQSSGEHLLHLINDFLDVLKIEIGQMTIVREAFSPGDLVRSALPFITSRFANKAVTVRHQIDGQLPIISADYMRIRQVLLSLLTYAAAGSGFVSASTRGVITVRVWGEPQNIIVSITSPGSSIPTDRLGTIFDDVLKADEDGVHSYGSTGLELLICKRLIELHGGRIWVERNTGGGSTFFFSLPRQDTARPERTELFPSAANKEGLEEQSKSAVSTIRAGSDQRSFSSQDPRIPVPRDPEAADRTILIVDDDADGREVLVGLLAPHGYRLLVTTNGPAALDLAAAHQPDLVLLDVMMPDMDGFEVCQRLRSTPGLAEIPIVLVTSLHDRESRLRGLAVGADDFLPKPVDPAELQLRVQTITRLNRYRLLLDERRQAAARAEAYNRTLEAQVARRTAELEAANRELEAFSYSVSHDLRAPLRGINGVAQIILETYAAALPDEVRGDLQLIQENVQHMNHLMEHLLHFSHLSRQPVTKQVVATEALIRQVAMEVLADQGERVIHMQVGRLPDCQADPTLLRQVLTNLLSNAVKFTRQRDVARIEIEGSVHDHEVVYWIRDNGAGFDPRIAHRLFKVFQRLHRTSDFEGTGVGLAIVQRIIARHGGRVWAEGNIDQGATFWFALPLEEESTDALGGATPG